MPCEEHCPNIRCPDEIVHPTGHRPILDASILALGTSTCGAIFLATLQSMSLIAADVVSRSKSQSLPTSTDETG